MNILGIGDDKPAEQGQQSKAKVYKYVCEVDCVYQGKYRRKGDVIVLAEKKEVPHFKFAEE